MLSRKPSLGDQILHLLRDSRYHRYSLPARDRYTKDVVDHYLRYYYEKMDALYSPEGGCRGDINSDEYHVYVDLTGAIESLEPRLRTAVTMFAESHKTRDIGEAVGEPSLRKVRELIHEAQRRIVAHLEGE